MKQMITLLFFSLAGTVLFSAQPPASNIRLIPGESKSWNGRMPRPQPLIPLSA